MKKNTVYTLGSLIILLICAFCFVVLPAVEGRTSRQSADTPVFGKYKGKEIKYEQGTEFANFVSQYGQMYQMYGQQLDQTAYYQIFNQSFKSTVLNYAYTDEVKKSGYVVPASAITREILPYFQDENGNYSSKLYKQASDETKQNLHDSASNALLADRFSNDNFASNDERVGLTSLYGLKNSGAEKNFIAKMNKEQRGFKMAAFSKSDYPLEEKLKFANQNAALFNKYDMSVITVEEKSNAESIAKRIANNEITFEDAVTEYSDKNYSDSEGKLTNSYQYQISSILQNKDDLASITGLGTGATSDIIQTNTGYSIFKNNTAVTKPDFDSEDTQRVVSTYMSAYEMTVIEDYFTAKANDFIKEVKTSDFDTAAEKLSVKTSEIAPFPLNYGNVDVLNTLSTSEDGMANAERNESLLKAAFALKLNELSSPIVLNNNIVVLQYTTASSSANDDVNVNLLVSYDQSAASDTIMKSDDLEDNFLSVYFENYMR